MGGSKKQTLGYRYFMGLHFGLCHGSVDAFLQLRGGDRTAWSGAVTSSQQIAVDAPELWGGDKKEGGIVGALDVMMGEPTQAPNDYLVSQLGTPMPAFRGMLSLVFRKGQVAAMNPYPKAWKFQVRRITAGWEGGSAWYPEKAEVYLSGTPETEGEELGLWGHGEGVVSGLRTTESPQAGGGDLPQLITMTLEPPDVPSGSRVLRRARVVIESIVRWDTGWLGGTSADQATLDAALVTAGREDLLGTISAEESYTAAADLGEPRDTFTVDLHSVVVTAIEPGDAVHFTVRAYSPDVPSSEVFAMNPAHIAYEALTNTDWGMGYPSAVIDAASFTAAADAFHAEGMGLCLQWVRSDTIQGFIQDVMNHAGAVCAQDPRTSLFRIIPIRGDYVVAELPEFRRGLNVLSVDSFERAAITETVNELTVHFTEVTTGKPGLVTVQQLANIQAQGGVVSQSMNYKGLPTAALSQRVALRDLAARSQPLCKVKLTTDRSAFGTLPGEVIRWSDDILGIVDMPMRVLTVNYGSLTSGAIQLVLAEDVYGLPETGYVAQQPTGWEEPSTAPQPSPDIEAFEAPYVGLHRAEGSSFVAGLDVTAGYVALAAARPSGVNYSVSLFTRTGSADFTETGSGDFSPGGPLLDPVGVLDTLLVLDNPRNLDQLEIGELAMLGTGPLAEMVSIAVVSVGSGAVSVARGCADTTPRAWPAGTRLWGIEDGLATGSTEYLLGETVDVRAVTVAPGGQLALGLAPSDSVTLNQRPARPYPPGKLRITDDLVADAAYPTSAAGELEVTWAHRDRILQQDQLIGEGEASIGPEAGTTYTVRYYLDGVLDETETGITGTAAAPYTLSGDGVASVEVEAVRDGLTSWQVASAEFDYLTAPLDARVTDSTDTRITDSGDRRTLD